MMASMVHSSIFRSKKDLTEDSESVLQGFEAPIQRLAAIKRAMTRTSQSNNLILEEDNFNKRSFSNKTLEQNRQEAREDLIDEMFDV